MPRICLSYRRTDSAIVGRIYDHLVQRYGGEAVFMDVSGIPYGADFRDHIQDVFRDTHVLIAVVGTGWLGHHASGTARIQDKLDPVRVEIHTALRQQIFVLPVLVDNAKMPAAEDLPRNIRKLAFRNAMRVDSGADFHFHIERLLSQVDEVLGIKPGAQPAVDGGRIIPIAQSSGVKTLPARNFAVRLAPYFVAPVILLLLAHYLLLMKLDANPVYLRLAAMAIPLACGFLLYRRLRPGLVTAAALGLVTALVAVAGMLTVVGFVDEHSILPTGSAEWQEAFEYAATITLATVAGSLLARVTSVGVPGSWRLF